LLDLALQRLKKRQPLLNRFRKRNPLAMANLPSDKIQSRLKLAYHAAHTLKHALGLLGIEVVERM
jgi:arginyl-tRNA synthetase